MSKLPLSLSILLSVASFSASANDVLYTEVGFINSSNQPLEVLVWGDSVGVVEPGETLSNPGILAEGLSIITPPNSDNAKMEFSRVRVQRDGCPQPICLKVD